MNWTPICSLDDILPGTGVGALLHGHQIAVFRLEDERLFALDNYDPRAQANVLARGLVGDIEGIPVVASPIYKQRISLIDGRCLEDESHSVRAHAVRLSGANVEVALNTELECAA